MSKAAAAGYTITGLKTFIGREGHGFNANLLRNGVKVAFVSDDASGGPFSFDWLDRSAPRVEGKTRNYKDEDMVRSMTPEEAKWEAFVYALPENPKPANEDDIWLRFDNDEMVLDEMIHAVQGEKKLKALLKKKVIFIRGESVMETKGTLTPEVMAKALAKYVSEAGTIVLNALSFDEALDIAIKRGIV